MQKIADHRERDVNGSNLELLTSYFD